MPEATRIAEPAAVYGAETVEANETRVISPDRVNGKFAPGWKGGPGRPKKGQSVPERLKRKVEKKGDAIVDAVIARMLREDSVGNRAFADVRDTIYGVPKQHLIVSQGADDPLLGMLTGAVVDAEYSVSRETIPAPDPQP